MSNLEGKRILVTGGAGFVGSFIVDLVFREKIREVIVLDNFIRGSRNNLKNILSWPDLRVVKGDIRNRQLLNDLFQEVDYCFHMAALRITHCATEPREALEVMYDGTYNILEMCVKHNVKKIVAASSASIYGQADEFPTQETHHPYNNVTLYGAAKMANELMYRSFAHMYGLSYNALRYFNIYGPRMDTHGRYTEVLIRWYRMIKEGQPPIIFGDGKQTMDFIYVEDVARATVTALTEGVENEVFNVASGTETSLEELCLALLKAMDSDLKPEYKDLPDDRKKVEVYRRLADTSKTRKMLNFESRVRLDQGLKMLVNWLDQCEA